MPSHSTILTAENSRAPTAALAVLCALAAAQVAAVSRAVWLSESRRAAAATSLASSGPPSPPPLPAAVSLGPPPVPGYAGASLPQPPPAPPSVPSAPGVPPSSAAFSPAPAAAGGPLDPRIAEYVETARQLRPLGDHAGAIAALKGADAIVPNHPAVLAELAAVHESLGDPEKARLVRSKIGALSSAAPPAESVLPPSTGLTTPSGFGESAIAVDKVLALGACQAARDPAVVRGERVVLRVPIRSQPGAAVNPAEVDIDVFFFDEVNGEKIEQTKADAPVSSWANAPVDWRDGLESLEVVYFMPEMNAEALRANGRRKFHGYIVKLYHQHKLQATAAEPVSLLNYGSEARPQPAGNPLLPPAGF